MKRTLKILILNLVLIFCSTYAFSEGKVDAVPFDYEHGNLFINISINAKTYKFLLTSTGYSAVSNKIIEQNNLKVNTENQTVKDVVFYSVKEIKIGNTFFRNIDARALNINDSFSLKCEKVDGIIGADMLSNRVLKIDYLNKKILLSDFISDFGFSNQVKIIDFKTIGTNNSPLIKVTIDNTTFENVRVNLGSNGTFSLPLKDFKKKVKDYKNVKYYGTEKFFAKSQVAFFQEICAMLPDVTIENQSMGPTMVSFYENGVSMIGNKILKDYDVVIDWRNKKLYLDNYVFHENYKVEDYGFYFYKRENKIEVVGIYEDSDADRQGLKNGDIIQKINDVDFTTISEQNLCELYFNFKNFFKNEPIKVRVLRGSKEIDFLIAKQIIIN